MATKARQVSLASVAPLSLVVGTIIWAVNLRMQLLLAVGAVYIQSFRLLFGVLTDNFGQKCHSPRPVRPSRLRGFFVLSRLRG